VDVKRGGEYVVGLGYEGVVTKVPFWFDLYWLYGITFILCFSIFIFVLQILFLKLFMSFFTLVISD
jgi:hypothetical protein